MKTMDVTMVRIYLTEGQRQMQPLLRLLREEQRVRGVTVLRGIAGFGPSGELHDATLLDLSLDLPLVLEFFDEPAKVARVLEHLQSHIKPGHVVSWPAQVNVSER